jgi:hypothetical protein
LRDALKRIAREAERPEQVERTAFTKCVEAHFVPFVRRRQDADWR